MAAPAADEALARLIAAGDDGAFDELYRRYSTPLARYAGRILRDPTAGEDVAQIAFLSAYQALRRGSSPEHFRSWLYRIARNAALEVIEQRGDVVPLLDGDGGADDPLDAHAQRADLIAALRTLPERQRAVYVLRELKGLRVGEIGAQLGLATEQVEQAMFAARNRLAEQLEFGERLDCTSVRNLAEARLTRAQKRALKSHLRACATCRVETPLRVGVLSYPAALFEVVRAGVAALFGGGSAAPIAAKAAAVVVAATAAVAAPIVADLVGSPSADAEPVRAQAIAAANDSRTLAASELFAVSFAGRMPPRVQRVPPAISHEPIAREPAPVGVASNLPAARTETAAETPEPESAQVNPTPLDVRPADEPADGPTRGPEPQREPDPEEIPLDEPTLNERPLDAPTRERALPLLNDGAVATEPAADEPIAAEPSSSGSITATDSSPPTR